VNCTPRTIWQFKQNKPSLVVADIVKQYPEVDPNFIYRVLLQRGVFKWLAVRRDVIKLKAEWKDEVRDLNRRKTAEERGYQKALIKCRAAVRALCHSERFRAPDFDRQANEFLERIRQNDNSKCSG